MSEEKQNSELQENESNESIDLSIDLNPEMYLNSEHNPKKSRLDSLYVAAEEKTYKAEEPVMGEEPNGKRRFAVAKQNGKSLTKEIPDGVHMVASESQIQQLVTLFVDNAIKYCDDGGEIKVSVHQKGKGVKIAGSNNYSAGKDVDYTRFLDRFYREDQSHNIDKGGFGIGLSIADSIVRQYRGKLDVGYQDGVIEFSATLKP